MERRKSLIPQNWFFFYYYYCLSSQTRNTMANKTILSLLSRRCVSVHSERLPQRRCSLCGEMLRKAWLHCFTGAEEENGTVTVQRIGSWAQRGDSPHSIREKDHNAPPPRWPPLTLRAAHKHNPNVHPTPSLWNFQSLLTLCFSADELICLWGVLWGVPFVCMYTHTHTYIYINLRARSQLTPAEYTTYP